MSMFPGAGAIVDYNDEGEPMGWDYPSDDGPDPDEWYDQYDDDECSECNYCGQTYCLEDCEPIRCEADIKGGVCQWRIPLDGKCPNESSHKYLED